MARDNIKRKGTGRKTIAILVDGETEKWYLDMLRRYENPMGITIKPDLPQKTRLVDQFKTVQANAEMYDTSVWIIDLDVVIREKSINELNRYLKEVKADPKIHVLINTPCLEFWFLQHLQDSGRYFADGDSVVRELKKSPVLNSYEKTEKYFIENNPDIYKRLRPHLAVALKNASKRGEFDALNPEKAKAEIYKLFSLLGLQIQ